jgi:hypothetical protein
MYARRQDRSAPNRGAPYVRYYYLFATQVGPGLASLSSYQAAARTTGLDLNSSLATNPKTSTVRLR